MPQLTLPDKLFKEAGRRARDAGFVSVDEFLVDWIETGFAEADESFDSQFTPEVMQALHTASSDLAAGKGLSESQMDQSLAELRIQWRKAKNL